jgi:hypothetical protein
VHRPFARQYANGYMRPAAPLDTPQQGVLPWAPCIRPSFRLRACELALLHFLLPLVGAISGLAWVALISALMLGGLSQGAPRGRGRR